MKKQFIGWIIFIGGLLLAWFNEGTAVDYNVAINEVEELIQVDSGNVQIRQEYLTTKELLRDNITGVTTEGLRLERTFFIKDQTRSSSWRELDEDSLNVENNEKPLVHGENHDIAEEIIDQLIGNVSCELKIDSTFQAKPLHYKGVKYTLSEISTNNAYFIGDASHNSLRITYNVLPYSNYTVLAEIKEKELKPYKATSGKYISYICRGDLADEYVIENLFTRNNVRTWVFRILSFILVIGGMVLLTSITNSLAIKYDIVQKVKSILGWTFAYLIGFLLTSFLISLSWAVHRPLFIIMFLSVILAGFIFIKFRK